MSSINDFQELGFSGEREKLDGFKVVHIGSPQDTTNARADIEFNVRKSLAWDSAFFTSPGVLEPDELFQTMNFRSTGNAINFLGREEEILLPSESLEPERARGVEKYCFRKSLAWDNAFFTSAGVLDPEELSIVNRGFKKCAAHKLPGINEVWRSADSISTIDSGCSSLASLEFELFEYSRGSYLQKPATTTSTLKLRRGRGLQNVHTSKGPEASSRMRIKPMPTSQRQSLNLHRPDRISKEAAVSSQTQLAAGRGKLNPSASLKPPKVLNRVNQPSTSAAKRACLGGNDVKMRTAKSPAEQSMAVSKKPCLEVSCRVTKSLTPPQKSLSSRSPTTTHDSRVYYSPYKGSSIASEDTAGKSPLDSIRKIDSPLVKSAPNGFNTGTPLRSTKTVKDELESSCHLSTLLLTPTSSSCTSPASSIDAWSSVSSSTTSMNKRSQNSVISSGTMSRQVSFESNVSQASDLDIHSHDQPCIGHGNQDIKVPNHRSEKRSLQTSPALSSASEHIKPSGLRVPSPKLGFFDEESSLVRSSGSLQFLSGGKSSVSRSGNYSGAINRSGKLHPPRHMDGIGNTKPALRKSGSPCPTIALSPRRPAHIEVQNASLTEGDMKRVIKSNGALKYEIGDDKNCLRTQEAGGKKRGSVELGIGKCSMAETKVTEGFMKALERVNNQPTKENEDPNMHSPGNNLFTLHNDGKANAYYFKDLIDGLTRNIGAIDLGCSVMKADKSAFIG